MSGIADRVATPVRVCVVGPSLDVVGGQSVQARHLVDGLREVAALRVRFVPTNPRFPRGLEMFERIKFARTIISTAIYIASLLREVRRHDVVHAYSASYYSYLLRPLPAMLVAKLYRKKVVLNYHSGEAEDHLRRWRWSARSMRLADEIVTPSRFLVDVFTRFGLPARAIFNVIDIDGIPHRERRSLRPVFLCNRHLEGLYNVACVVRAFARIQRSVPDARLILAGEGRERAALMELVRSLSVRNVEFRGRVDQATMRRLYDEADVLLNGSDIDNMPVSIIEAFAAGLPVVTTNAGGIPYIVTHDETGLVVPRDDDEAMATAAMRLLQDPALASRIATLARHECVAQYVWPTVQHEWEDVYTALGGPPSTVMAS